jgi:hypothetical protein
MRWKNGVALLLACGALGSCGKGTAPVISDLTLSASSVKPGGQVKAEFTAKDPDGLTSLKIAYRLSGAATQPEVTVSVAGAFEGMTEQRVDFLLALSAAAPAGSYTLTIAAIDVQDNRSNELSASFQVE